MSYGPGFVATVAATLPTQTTADRASGDAAASGEALGDRSHTPVAARRIAVRRGLPNHK